MRKSVRHDDGVSEGRRFFSVSRVFDIYSRSFIEKDRVQKNSSESMYGHSWKQISSFSIHFSSSYVSSSGQSTLLTSG